MKPGRWSRGGALALSALLSPALEAQDPIFEDGFEWGSICAWSNDIWFTDADGDLFGDSSEIGIPSDCPAPAGRVPNNGDCDDFDPTVNPSALERCNDIDDDCDAGVDTGCDDDGDLFCDGAMETSGHPTVCPNGGGDCNDEDPDTHPGATEVCDGVDNDCNNIVDDGDTEVSWFTDADEDTYGSSEDPGVLSSCPQPGRVDNNEDCDDTDFNVNPGAIEVCNDIDDDCADGIDTGCDDDQDGYCDASMTTLGIPAICPSGGGDCDDADASSHPGGTEVCDGADNDCNGLVDDGVCSAAVPR